MAAIVRATEAREVMETGKRIRSCTATKQTFFACMSRRKGHLGSAELNEMCSTVCLDIARTDKLY